MIRSFLRATKFALAGTGLILGFAGCNSSKPAPVPAPVVPQVFVPVPPAPTVVVPAPVSRPRPAADASDNMAANILAWDAVTKKYPARPGETNASFTFSLTNMSPEVVMIYDTSTTCECTVAQLPARPWTLPPGAGGQIHASLDLRNRTTDVTNYVIVFTSKGNRLLTVAAILPPP